MRNIHYGWWIVVACCAINSLSGIISSSAVNFFDPVAEELHTGIGQISLYMTIMVLTSSTLLPMYGQVLEKHLRAILLFAGTAQCVVFALLGTLHHVYQFWIAGVFLGIGLAATYSLATPILINMWFQKKQGLATGISFSFLGISGAVFSVITGNIIGSMGWRMAYFVLALCAAVIYMPTVFFLVRTPQEKGVLPYGAEDKKNTSETVNNAEMETGITLQRALRHPSFYLMLACAALLTLAGSESTQIPSFSVRYFGMSIEDGAQILAINSIGVTIGTIILGVICDKIGHAKTMLVAMGLALTGNLMLITGSTILVRPASFIIGIGFSSVTVLLALFATHVFGKREYSCIWSIILSAASVSSAVAISLYGFIYDVMGSYYPVFVMVAVISVSVAIAGMAALKCRAKF